MKTCVGKKKSSPRGKNSRVSLQTTKEKERKKKKEKKDAAKTTFLMTFDEEIELKNQNEMTS